MVRNERDASAGVGPAPAVAAPPAVVRTALLTAAAMLAFAGNSLLCRAALDRALIDAATFTSVRIASGAVALAVLMLAVGRSARPSLHAWRSILALFAYMVFFSFAYRALAAGTGALLLFGAVQLTMFVAAHRRGEQFSVVSWLGLALAFAGLVYLVSPGLAAPEPIGASMMAAAGIAWGLYTLRGTGAADPLATTAANFLGAVPFTLALSLVFLADIEVTPAGLAFAVASGAVTSGLGYAVWYAALKGLTAGHAATVQLCVPVVAAVGGVLLLEEPVTARLVVASAMVLGGVGVVLSRRARQSS